MHIYQIIVPLIAGLLIYLTIRQHLKGRNTLFEMLAWCFIWLLISLVAIFPDLVTDRLARVLGIKSNVNAFIFLSLGVLFFIQYNLFMAIKRQNRIISDMVRKIALKDHEHQEKNGS